MLSACSYVYADNLQHVFKMSASRTHASFESHTPLVNGCVDDVLFNAAPNIQQTLSQFVNISNLCLVDALLRCSPYFVIHRAKIWTVRWPLFRWHKVRRVSRRKSSIVWLLDVSLLCQFVTWTFRYHLRRFATWTLRYLDVSHLQDVSHLWTFRYQDVSLPPWTFRHLSQSL